MTSKIQNVGVESIKGRGFRMCLKLKYYLFKINIVIGQHI